MIKKYGLRLIKEDVINWLRERERLLMYIVQDKVGDKQIDIAPSGTGTKLCRGEGI